MTDVEDNSLATGHPYYYCYEPGMPLRPAPPRIEWSDIWTPPRRNILRRWMRDVDAHDHPLLPLLRDHFWQGDEYMDPVVMHFREIGMPAGRAMLDQALDHGIESVSDAPPALVELFRQLDNPPPWYDPERWEQGRRLWNSTSLSGRLAMAIQDAMGTFVGAEVSTATGITGRFVNDLDRRNTETLQWFYSVTKPGALDRHAAEFKETVRVRMMHSQVRLAILQSWTAEEYAHHGNPISSAMTMVAGTTFGLIPVLTDDRYGRRASWADLDAVTHYWAYVSHVFGAGSAIIPANAADALAIMNYGVATAGGPTAWTQTMVGAAAEALDRAPGLRGNLTRATVAPALGFFAFFSGEPLVRALLRGTRFRDIAIEPWRTLAEVFVRADVALRRIDDVLPGARRRQARRAVRGDLFEGVAQTLARARARRLGIVADYTQHDVPKVPGCPASFG